MRNNPIGSRPTTHRREVFRGTYCCRESSCTVLGRRLRPVRYFVEAYLSFHGVDPGNSRRSSLGRLKRPVRRRGPVGPGRSRLLMTRYVGPAAAVHVLVRYNEFLAPTTESTRTRWVVTVFDCKGIAAIQRERIVAARRSASVAAQ